MDIYGLSRVSIDYPWISMDYLRIPIGSLTGANHQQHLLRMDLWLSWHMDLRPGPHGVQRKGPKKGAIFMDGPSMIIIDGPSMNSLIEIH